MLQFINLVAKLHLQGISISISTLSKIEKGTCNLSTSQLIALGKILRCNYSNFFLSC